MPEKIGIIILAAGASRRMGRPKQLLKVGKYTLLERAIQVATALENQETIVVLGANATKIKQAIPEQTTPFINNENWQVGMGTSLKKGVQYFLAQATVPKIIIIMVCDQPYLTTKILEKMVTTYQNTKTNIVATKYQEINGVPALFSNQLFEKLATLDADEGARKIIKNYQGKLAYVDFPEGKIDLDTQEAYQYFLKKEGIIL